MISVATRVFALLGDPVEHSLSPLIQNAAFRAAGLDAVYLALPVRQADLPTLIHVLAHAGGGGNVTLPHKSAAAASVELPSEAVTRTGACNTFWLDEGRIRGENTDVGGFRAAASSVIGRLAGARVLLLGGGGAARAAAVALLDARADAVAVLNRTPERARELIETLDPGGRRLAALERSSLRREGFDLVVNATSLGLHDSDPLPLDLAGIGRVGAALDLVYQRGGTPWIRHARELGIPGEDGTLMLLEQAAAAFRCWWGRDAPLAEMERALADASTH